MGRTSLGRRVVQHLGAYGLGIVLALPAIADETMEIRSNGEQAPRQKVQATSGAAKTLPEGVLRVRLPYQNFYGKKGYDENGQLKNLGFEVNINATALAVEYGLSDRLSLAFVAPFITSNTAGLNAGEIRTNNFKFRREYARYSNAVKGLMMSQGLCANQQQCESYLSNPNYRIPANQEIMLTTGETVKASADEPVARQIDRLLMRSITPAEGKTGVGDIQLGALYNVYADSRITASVGGGLRLPTGEFTDVPAGMRAIGGGVTDLGLRVNLDYHVAPWMVIALQHQVEQMLIPGRKTKNSGIYNDRTNTGDPSAEMAIKIGSDGRDNDQRFERYGLGHDGFVGLNFGFAGIADFLAPLGAGVQYAWHQGRETRYDGEAWNRDGWRYDEITSLRSLGLSLSWNGLAMKPLVPLSLVYDYKAPISGENATVAVAKNSFQLMGYYKF